MEVKPTHAKIGKCEVCDAIDTKIWCVYGNMWFCDSCLEKEKESQKELESGADNRVEEVNKVNRAITEAQKLDSTIQVRTDLFNAATVSIVELKAQIDMDTTIINKPYALAEELMKRFGHFKQVVFELNQKIVEAGNQQKAIQVYLNQLANSLREAERVKLKIENINYKPAAPKISKPTPIKTTAKKLDKVELRKYAAELGVSEFTLQMIVVQKGLSVSDAATILRQSINRGKAGL